MVSRIYVEKKPASTLRRSSSEQSSRASSPRGWPPDARLRNRQPLRRGGPERRALRALRSRGLLRAAGRRHRARAARRRSRRGRPRLRRGGAARPV